MTAPGIINTNKRRERFTMLANAMLRDPALSLKAKGLLGVMLSFPDDWRYYMTHLETQSSDGRESHQTAMKELIAAGYITRFPAKDPETGRLKGWEYRVTDERSTRQTGKPSDGKPATTNTDSTKTDNTKTEKNPPTPQGVELPEWLSEEVWGDWLQHRREIKKPMTATASQKLLAKLGRLRDQGHDPASLIDEAISNGSQSVYEPKGSAKGSARRPATQADANQRFIERVQDTSAIAGVFDD